MKSSCFRKKKHKKLINGRTRFDPGCSADSVVCFVNTYPLVITGYPAFEQLGPIKSSHRFCIMFLMTGKKKNVIRTGAVGHFARSNLDK